MTDEQRKLVEDNIELAYHFVYTYCNNYDIEFDDKIQLASFALCKAAISFDDHEGISFSTYAYKVMLNEFFTYILKLLK